MYFSIATRHLDCRLTAKLRVQRTWVWLAPGSTTHAFGSAKTGRNPSLRLKYTPKLFQQWNADLLSRSSVVSPEIQTHLYNCLILITYTKYILTWHKDAAGALPTWSKWESMLRNYLLKTSAVPTLVTFRFAYLSFRKIQWPTGILFPSMLSIQHDMK